MAKYPVSLSRLLAPALLLALGALPLVATPLGQDYYVTFFTRVLIMATAAAGLNLILGFGGLVSMGHALYLGAGVYAVGILSAGHGVHNGYLQIAAALGATLLLAIPIGLVCLRTSGMAFIMITLAFAQMAHYIAVTLRDYGGDDGMAIARHSDFIWFTLADRTTLYFAVFALLLATLYAMYRLVRSPFGLALRGLRLNERRLSALGYPTLRYKLIAYVISALICALAGVMLANLSLFMSPSYLQWQVSGELLTMAVLGGMGAVIGPLYGALALLGLEELLVSVSLPLPWGWDARLSEHPMWTVGLFLVAVAIGLRDGLHGLLHRRERP